MARRALAWLLALVLGGCTAAAPPASPGGTPAAAPPASPGGTPAAAPPASPGGAPAARLLLATADLPGGPMLMRPVDPASLADLPGYPALPFGHHFTHAFSPDGRTLAAILWPSGTTNRGGVLHLVDLGAWRDLATGVTFDEHVEALFFSADGRSLYWLQPGTTDRAHGLPRDYALHRYDPGAGAPRVVARLPGTFMPYQARLLAGGRRLAIYGQPVDSDHVAAGPPRVLGIRLPDGGLAMDVSLDGLRAGPRRTGGEVAFAHDGPGVAWDEARDLLYLVHAGNPRVTVVDLARGRVLRETDVRPRASLLERLGLESRAAAKMVPGTRLQAAVSPDGARLFVTGVREEVGREQGENGRWWRRMIPLGLQVIDTAGLQEIKRLDVPVDSLALAPGGRHLVLWGLQTESVSDNTRWITGVYVLDTQSLVAQLPLLPGEPAVFAGFSADGHHAYVAVPAGAGADGRLDHRVLELATHRFLAHREMPPGYGGYLRP